MVRFLIQKRADYLAKDEDRITPLKLAAKNGHAETVTSLLENAKSIYESDAAPIYSEDCVTSLHYAALAGHAPVIDVILKRDAELKEIPKNIALSSEFDVRIAQNEVTGKSDRLA